MPNAEKQNRLKVRTPQFAALRLMNKVNALYQGNFIGTDEKAFLSQGIRSGMNTGDYTALYDWLDKICPRASPDNPFFSQMREILREEAHE